MLRERHLKRNRQLDDERQMVSVRLGIADVEEEASTLVHRHLAELAAELRILLPDVKG